MQASKNGCPRQRRNGRWREGFERSDCGSCSGPFVRVHANDVHQVMSALFFSVSPSSLTPSARWLSRTRLFWQRRQTNHRPIQMGEFFRSACAKLLVNLNQIHQWGVGLSGACEAPCRGASSNRSFATHTEPMVAADLDRTATAFLRRVRLD